MIFDEMHSGWILFRADLRARYRDSLFGMFWMAVPIFITGFAFIFLKRIGVVKFESYVMQYASYAFTGITLWQIFLSGANNPIRCLSAGKKSLLNSQLTVHTVYFQALFHSLFELLFKYAALGAILCAIGDFAIGSWAPGILMAAGIMLIGLSIGCFVAPMACIFNDIKHLFDACLLLLFFVTPIFHNGSRNHILQNLFEFNPLFYVIHAARTMIVSVEIIYLNQFIAITVAFVGIGYFGVWMSDRLRSFIVERM